VASLGGQGPALAGLVVVNNGRDAVSAEVARGFRGPVEVIEPEANLGTGGGLGRAFSAVLNATEASHLWVLDDDAVAGDGALAAMLGAAEHARADAVSPLVPDVRGIVTWFPGPLAQPAWDVIRSGVTPAQFVARCGTAPLGWNWATWASLLVSRRAVESVGLPRTDFWYQATDIEYTLRLSHRYRCVLAPAAVCPHLPPPETAERRRLKERWSLQNNAYLSVRLPHGRRALRHLPGNHYRHWRRHGAFAESVAAFWRGAVLGRPVGADAYFAAERSQP
jgi:GT2 family glycosyltransferase